MIDSTSKFDSDHLWDVAVVGAGVIGLACAFQLAQRRKLGCRPRARTARSRREQRRCRRAQCEAGA